MANISPWLECPKNTFIINANYDIYILFNIISALIMFIVFFIRHNKPKYEIICNDIIYYYVLMNISIGIIMFIYQFTASHGFLIL